MRTGPRFVLLVTALLLVCGVISAGSASAAPSGQGDVRVTFTTPAGVPGGVQLTGRTTQLATKAPPGTSTTVTLRLPVGAYRVRPQAVTFGGRMYAPTATRPEIYVRAGVRTDLGVRYIPVAGAYDLHTVEMTQNSISLAWAAPAGATFALRRTLGTTPVAHRGQGTAVRVSGRSAVDTGLQPGTQYSYALFTSVRGRWTGPFPLVAGTASPDGTTEAAFTAAPSTLLAAPSDIVSASPTGSGLDVGLTARTPTPLVGSAVVLPQSDALPGGFLGVVTSLSPDGRTIHLVAAGLGDAFDYFSIDVPEFGAEPEIGPAAAGAAADAAGDLSGQQLTPEERAAAPTPAEAAAEASGPMALGVGVECSDAVDQTITYSPSIQLGGHFKAKVDTHNFLGVNIPSGASLDMSITATVTGAMAVETSGSTTCSLDIDPVLRTITAYPVPISFMLEPVAEISIASAVKVSNIGMTVTAGVRLSGTMGLTSGASFSGSPILSANPLTPSIAVNGTIGATLGGKLVVGPGAGTKDAGVIVGVGGEFNPLEAEFEAEVGSQNCLSATVGASWGLIVTAKAWVPGWSVSQKITVDALQWDAQYPGSPWDLPTGCADAPDPGDAVIGEGVTVISDSVGGSPVQWGHVDGFAPGQKTWVLSTGQIENALGTPDEFASTDLGQPGDSGLSDLVGGRPTFDAAYYEATLIPTGSTLHVRYVFASEEYPEYVGSSYNDVMAVLVDGQNCAIVPGTSDPVSVNAVNAGTNAAHYVDNSSGAAGYATSMDGLTVPLTCSVPVTPGEAVTIRIGVADTSDGIYDSAVALVDKGIWTD